MKSVEKTTGKISDYFCFIDLEFQVYAWLWISFKYGEKLNKFMENINLFKCKIS